MTSADKRIVLELCGVVDVVAASYPSVHATAMVRLCDRLKAKAGIAKRIQHIAKEATLAAKRETKRKTHREETADLYADAMVRANGKCEHCGLRFKDYDPPELDHLVSGNGARRQEQAIENVWLIHRSCHQQRHRHPEEFKGSVRCFLGEHGYPVPRRFR